RSVDADSGLGPFLLPIISVDRHVSDAGFRSIGIVVPDSSSCTPPHSNCAYGASRNLPVGSRSASERSDKVCALRAFHTANDNSLLLRPRHNVPALSEWRY